MDDPLRYKNITYTKAAVDFAGSEKLEKTRRSYLVFLIVLLFIEFAGVEIQSATLAVVSAKVERPWVVSLGFWVLFLYSFSVYYLAQSKELAFFTLRHGQSATFFSSLNRTSFVADLRAATNADYFQPGAGLVKVHNDKLTVIQYEVTSIPPEALPKIATFNAAESTYSYVHEPNDWLYFNKTVPLLRPAVSFNYFVYVLPAHIGAALIGYKIAERVSAALASGA